VTGQTAGEKRFGDRPGRVDCDSVQCFSVQWPEVTSVPREEGAAAEADRGGEDRPVLFGDRERGGQCRIDGMARRDTQMPQFGIHGNITVRQLQRDVPPRFFHHIGIRPAFVPRLAEYGEQLSDRAVGFGG